MPYIYLKWTVCFAFIALNNLSLGKKISISHCCNSVKEDHYFSKLSFVACLLRQQQWVKQGECIRLSILGIRAKIEWEEKEMRRKKTTLLSNKYKEMRKTLSYQSSFEHRKLFYVGVPKSGMGKRSMRSNQALSKQLKVSLCPSLRAAVITSLYFSFKLP